MRWVMAITALRHHLVVVVVVAWKKSTFAIPLFALHGVGVLVDSESALNSGMRAKHGFAATGDMNIVLIDHPGYIRRCETFFLRSEAYSAVHLNC
jgi:hypothetical protein